MGLDTVELILDIEEAFAISLPDQEASRIATVGELYEFVLARVHANEAAPVCLTAVAFYMLRRAARKLGVADRLRPRDATLRLLPTAHRREFWSRLEREAELQLPRLCRPTWPVALGTGLVAASSLLLGWLVWNSTGSPLAALISTASNAVLVGSLVEFCTRPLATLPDRHFRTLRGLAESVLANNYQQLAARRQGANPSDVWAALRAIVVEQLRVPPERVTPDARFVNDLGC